jgi:hypothetical protein
VFDLPLNLPLTLLANYREILGSCLLAELLRGINVFQVQADVVGAGAKQLSHLRLRQPNGVVIKSDLELELAIFGLVNLHLLGVGVHAVSTFCGLGKLSSKSR